MEEQDLLVSENSSVQYERVNTLTDRESVRF